jgi:hypothetical protein
MSDTLATTRPGGPSPERRSWLLLSLAALLVVGTVVAAAVLGIERPPSLPHVRDVPDPAPSGAVAWSAWNGNQQCVHVVTPTGEERRPWCSNEGYDVVGWASSGDLVVHSWETPGRLRTIDPVTGEVTGRSSGDPDELAGDRPPDEAAWGEQVGGELVLVAAADDRELWRVQASDRYRITASARSADGEWIAVVDSAERLLVLPADGSSEPRVWATDVPGWIQLVWEDTAAVAEG